MSDIHANLEALEAVLLDAERQKADEIVCLGDVVGYGPSPVEAVDLVRGCVAAAVRGNHEDMVTRSVPLHIDPSAAAAALWTRKLLEPGRGANGADAEAPAAEDPAEKKARWAWLSHLPHTFGYEGLLLAHGTPESTIEYVMGPADARKVFREQLDEDEPVCFIGHTHVPARWIDDGNRVTKGDVEPGKRQEVRRRGGFRHLVNVGSVGQPRDHDPRACYVLWHGDGTIEYRRVEYDVEATVRRIFKVKALPRTLGERLLCGE